jgi:glyoxylase-like metal-dependent hydrolase (beta-lactamase superfamily II)
MALLDRRSVLIGIAASSSLAVIGAPAALARAPPAGTQAPGVHRIKVGDIEVTALLDGHLPLQRELFPAAMADQAASDRLLDQAFLPHQPVPTAINAYLVNTGNRLVLIDTGTANLMGPDLGRVGANLAAAGVTPDQVDTVLLTHVHPDHFGGLVTTEGRPTFPNAEVLITEADAAFWTDQGIASRAPADFQPFWTMATQVITACGDRVRRITPGGAVLPGITSIAAPGHTVGHTGYRLSSGNAQLLVWGDIVHVGPYQFARPDWSLAFDTDLPQAAATRRRVFDMVATDRLMVAGAHIAFPGIGHVARSGDAFAFVPVEWQPL